MSQPLKRPSWLSVALGSLVLAIVTSAITVAVNYGKQEAAMASLTARNDELNKSLNKQEKNAEMREESYRNLEALLNATKVNLQYLKDERCKPLVSQVSYYSTMVSVANSPAVADDAKAILKGYQETLQACYSSPLSANQLDIRP